MLLALQHAFVIEGLLMQDTKKSYRTSIIERVAITALFVESCRTLIHQSLIAMSANRFLKLFLSYFLRGLIFTIPLTVIVWGVVKVFGMIDGWVPSKIPGLGIAILIVFITLVGWLGSSILFEPLKAYFNRLLDGAPLLKTIYTAIKDLLGTVVGKRKGFKHPVLVRLEPGSNVERIGFITEENLKELGLPENRVAVYLPFSYSFSGHLVIVPTEALTPINAKSADVMKFIVSGGVAQMEQTETE